jgi:signal transduction histidine kinase/ActR/RegA family two-component response regulator/PAS domain-containing protein
MALRRATNTSVLASRTRGSLSVRAVAIAVVAPLLVTLLKLAYFESLGRLPFLLYFAAVLLSTWYGGLAAGVISTALAALAGTLLFLPRMGPATFEAFAHLRAITFVVEALTIAYVTDRLRRVRAQAAAAADEARLSLAKLEGVLAGVSHGITMQDSTGKLVYANDIAAQQVGFADAASMLSASTDQLAPRYQVMRPDGSIVPLERLPGRRVLRGEVDNVEEVMRIRRLSDGHESWSLVRASAVRLPGGEVPYAVNVVQDLTQARADERQRSFLSDATRELNSSLNYRDTLAVVARLAVPAIADWCVVDLWEGDRLVRLAAEHVDPSKRELLFEMDRLYPVDPSAEGGRAAVLRGDQPVMVPALSEADWASFVRDDQHREMLRQLDLRGFIVVPLRAQGETLGVLSLVMASSGRHHSENDLRLAIELAERAGLAVAHARAFAQAEQSRNEAEAANRTKDEFLAMLGHELRNPLAPIVTAVHLMKMRRADLFERERTIIERQVRHLVTLVDDLLDVSRITRGKVELNKEPVDLHDTVARALELAAPLIEKRKHQVSLQLAPQLMVDGDAVRLSQVVSNLLTNAAKYTPVGGQIDVRGEREDGAVVLRVRDNGVGVEPELLPHVFDLFVQGRQALDRAGGGLGLGLAIARSVVELHGGTVSVHSEGNGRGAEFAIRLPPGVMPKRSSIPVSGQLVDGSAEGRPRVMVVDDNSDAAATLSDALRVYGHEVHTAEDAASALALAERTAPQIAVLDIGLPGMDGYELARRLRQLPGFGAIKLVAVTGYGQASDKQRALAAGFDEHLVKPISVQALRSVLERLDQPTALPPAAVD